MCDKLCIQRFRAPSILPAPGPLFSFISSMSFLIIKIDAVVPLLKQHLSTVSIVLYWRIKTFFYSFIVNCLPLRCIWKIRHLHQTFFE